MLVFPKVNRKLPELFEIIIDHDREFEQLVHSKVVDMVDFIKKKHRKGGLIRAAAEYVKRQQKSGNDK